MLLTPISRRIIEEEAGKPIQEIVSEDFNQSPGNNQRYPRYLIPEEVEKLRKETAQRRFPQAHKHWYDPQMFLRYFR
ncbi:hypothetical protein J4463_01450 [Candidatus Pacearchaeota archaeon]|nr:hypothetical protein [Candidatus Pacearchaeota archaeon]